MSSPKQAVAIVKASCDFLLISDRLPAQQLQQQLQLLPASAAAIAAVAAVAAAAAAGAVAAAAAAAAPGNHRKQMGNHRTTIGKPYETHRQTSAK